MKAGIDQDALIEMFSSASAKQTEALRKQVHDATLGALQGRELTLKNIRSVVQAVTQAAGTGALQNAGPKVDVQAMLDTAVAGVDDALLKAVEANRVALERFAEQGASLKDKTLKKALSDLEKMEDNMFDALKKAAEGAGGPLAAPWAQVLDKFQVKGTATGAQATQAAQDLATRMQSAMRDSRSASLKAAQALADSYTALVSGVLIGMSDALKAGGASATPKKK
jgi:hypothetical protein